MDHVIMVVMYKLLYRRIENQRSVVQGLIFRWIGSGFRSKNENID